MLRERDEVKNKIPFFFCRTFRQRAEAQRVYINFCSGRGKNGLCRVCFTHKILHELFIHVEPKAFILLMEFFFD